MPPLRLSLEGVRLKKLHILCKRQVTAPEAQTSCGVFSVVSLHAADGLSVYLDNSPAPSRGSLPLDFLAQAHPLHVHHATHQPRARYRPRGPWHCVQTHWS